MTVASRKRITGVFNLQPYVIDYSLPAMQVWKKLPEKFPAEVIDNKLYVSPPPTSYHATICDRITDEIKAYVRMHGLGEVWHNPVGVYFKGPGKTVVIPDIIFVSKNNRNIKTERAGLFGVPDLLIEILSSNRRYDLTTKKNLYERTGVKEIWYVDPETKSAQGYLLVKGKYGEAILSHAELYIRVLNTVIRF